LIGQNVCGVSGSSGGGTASTGLAPEKVARVDMTTAATTSRIAASLCFIDLQPFCSAPLLLR
jgi:hypothetical protein